MKRIILAGALAASCAACAPPTAARAPDPAAGASATASKAGRASPDATSPDAMSPDAMNPDAMNPDGKSRTGSSAATSFPTGVPISWTLAEHTEGPGCFGLGRADELLCRADRRIIQARAAGNDKLVACYRRKGSELRTAYRIAEESRERIHANGDAATLAKERLTAAEQALERDYASLEGCAGPVGKEPDTVRVIVPPLPNDAALPAARLPNDKITTVL